LFNDKDGAKNKMVLISRMAEHLLQAIPKLQVAIHSLMLRSSGEHSNRVLSIIGIVWMTDSTITSVASVCHNFLSSQQTLLQPRPEDLRSGQEPQVKGPLNATIQPVLIQTAISHCNPGPLNLWDHQAFEKGVGSGIMKSIPSTVTRQRSPVSPMSWFSH
jgi:hypothetical protein